MWPCENGTCHFNDLSFWRFFPCSTGILAQFERPISVIRPVLVLMVFPFSCRYFSWFRSGKPQPKFTAEAVQFGCKNVKTC